MRWFPPIVPRVVARRRGANAIGKQADGRDTLVVFRRFARRVSNRPERLVEVSLAVGPVIFAPLGAKVGRASPSSGSTRRLRRLTAKAIQRSRQPMVIRFPVLSRPPRAFDLIESAQISAARDGHLA